MPIFSPSNIEYLGSKPNFTRDTYDTLEAMQAALEAGYIDEGHLTYCRETGITYRAVRVNDDLIWEDTIGDLQKDLTEKILEDEKVTSEALWDLNTRMEHVEKDLSGDIIGGIGYRLEKVWDMYTHKVATSFWSKTDTQKLRQGTTHIYTVTFEWTWDSRIGATGVMYKVGDDQWTEKSFEEMGVTHDSETAAWSTDVEVPLGTEPVVLSSKFNDSDSSGFAEITITPVEPKITWLVSGLPGSWVPLDLRKTEPLTMEVTGSYLSEDALGNKILDSDGDILKTISEVSDDDVVVTNVIDIDPSVVQPFTMSWQTDVGVTVDSYTYTPQPGFFVISSQENAWDGSDAGLEAFMRNSTGGYQTWIKSATTDIPETEYTAGSTAAYISQFDIRNLVAKSMPQGSDTWTTISGFSESGTITYLGKTYYYRLNPNIGAGIFSFKFA